MIVNQITDDSNDRVISILRNGLINVEDYVKENYSPECDQDPANLFFILKNGRYKTGKYYVIEEEGEYVASAGWYEYDIDTALLMTRSYTSKQYRTKFLLGKELLPRMINECSHYKNVWITFNKYNKALYDWLCRPTKENTYWPESWHKFQPIGLKEIFYTEQYVIELIK